MGKKMRENFDAYRLEINLVMSIGVVLDPRYKAKWVEFHYKELYGFTGYLYVYNNFKTRLAALFSVYDSQNTNATENYFGIRNSVSSSSMMDSSNADESDPYYDEFMMQNNEFEVQKSELEKYLKEPMLNKVSSRDEFVFDILSWWKLNAPKYPTLAKMTRDVLAVPVTSVASKPMFSASGRVLTTHRTLLDHVVVEALLFLSDWLPDFFSTDMEVKE
ncbi:zinc finger BED domain-containing protein RICESLEEPER 1-like [Papaver somniferum]|uniref:zinc finger BED domain-containing protein RICESLEEPER 1-like n=1 Tax=Papaver somniferum TaxID=3469 RepID=UPI000E705C5E|nr:zinc finger BED domain-containing protein RICESLEEPER 1-like [Papaver somniferum]